jgi:hypothetical protein
VVKHHSMQRYREVEINSCGFLYWYWIELKYYATSRKVADSIPNEVIGFFQLTCFFQPHHGPGVDSASNRNEYRESSWG